MSSLERGAIQKMMMILSPLLNSAQLFLDLLILVHENNVDLMIWLFGEK